MKAAVMYGVGQPLMIEDVDVDEPRAGEVLVRTSASGVCHSDLHFMEGSYPTAVPIVLGHESAGVVEKVGPGVTKAKPGDRVVIAFVASCGFCDNCVQGKPYLCNNTANLGRGDRLHLKGQPIPQFANMSAFAEQQLVSENACVPVPDAVPMEVACLVGCSVMTGVGAVTNTARIPVGSTVAVIGAGGVGLNVIQGAALAGASRIIAVDIFENKLAAAKTFGATDVIDASDTDPVQQVMQMTGGGVDFAFEAIGLAKTAEQCYGMIKRGGRAVVVGMVPVSQSVTLPGFSFLQEKGIIGSFYGSSRQTHDMPWLMELYRQRRLKLDELITRRYHLGEINEAYAALKNGEVNRSVIVFE
jgi:S-(hydroxymethyl)glutathione dehydrogenase/alcohol dehydrogenase